MPYKYLWFLLDSGLNASADAKYCAPTGALV